MKKFILATVFSVFAGTAIAQTPHVCEQVSNLAFNFAMGRDAGMPIQYTQRLILSADVEAEIQAFALNMLQIVYENPLTSPAQNRAAAYVACMETLGAPS